MKKETYIIGVTTYDEWMMLYETHVGLNDKWLTLLYSVWGETENESINNAEKLVDILNFKLN